MEQGLLVVFLTFFPFLGGFPAPTNPRPRHTRVLARVQASNPEDMLWLMSRAGYKPVMEYLGGTEIGGAFVGGTLLHPCVPSCFATASLGFELFIMAEESGDAGRRAVSLSAPDVGRGRLRGEVAVRTPAVGCSQRLLNRDHFKEYYVGMPMVGGLPLRRHGDELEELPGLGYLKAGGRCDDTMNLGGIKVRSCQLPGTACCAVPLAAWYGTFVCLRLSAADVLHVLRGLRIPEPLDRSSGRAGAPCWCI